MEKFLAECEQDGRDAAAKLRADFARAHRLGETFHDYCCDAAVEAVYHTLMRPDYAGLDKAQADHDGQLAYLRGVGVE
jgi:hypothetical protein